MKADRYLPWHTVYLVRRHDAPEAHRGGPDRRVPTAAAAVLVGGCLLYRLPPITDRMGRRASTAAVHSGNPSNGN